MTGPAGRAVASQVPSSRATPSDTERVGTVSEHRHVHVESARACRACHGHLFVDDFTAFTEGAAQRGIHPETREPYAYGVRKATYRDPDGNEVGVGGAPVLT